MILGELSRYGDRSLEILSIHLLPKALGVECTSVENQASTRSSLPTRRASRMSRSKGREKSPGAAGPKLAPAITTHDTQTHGYI